MKTIQLICPSIIYYQAENQFEVDAPRFNYLMIQYHGKTTTTLRRHKQSDEQWRQAIKNSLIEQLSNKQSITDPKRALDHLINLFHQSGLICHPLNQLKPLCMVPTTSEAAEDDFSQVGFFHDTSSPELTINVTDNAIQVSSQISTQVTSFNASFEKPFYYRTQSQVDIPLTQPFNHYTTTNVLIESPREQDLQHLLGRNLKFLNDSVAFLSQYLAWSSKRKQYFKQQIDILLAIQDHISLEELNHQVNQLTQQFLYQSQPCLQQAFNKIKKLHDHVKYLDQNTQWHFYTLDNLLEQDNPDILSYHREFITELTSQGQLWQALSKAQAYFSEPACYDHEQPIPQLDIGLEEANINTSPNQNNNPQQPEVSQAGDDNDELTCYEQQLDLLLQYLHDLEHHRQTTIPIKQIIQTALDYQCTQQIRCILQLPNDADEEQLQGALQAWLTMNVKLLHYMQYNDKAIYTRLLQQHLTNLQKTYDLNLELKQLIDTAWENQLTSALYYYLGLLPEFTQQQVHDTIHTWLQLPLSELKTSSALPDNEHKQHYCQWLQSLSQTITSIHSGKDFTKTNQANSQIELDSSLPHPPPREASTQTNITHYSVYSYRSATNPSLWAGSSCNSQQDPNDSDTQITREQSHTLTDCSQLSTSPP